jgi:hypothetical protein
MRASRSWRVEKIDNAVRPISVKAMTTIDLITQEVSEYQLDPSINQHTNIYHSIFLYISKHQQTPLLTPNRQPPKKCPHPQSPTSFPPPLGSPTLIFPSLSTAMPSPTPPQMASSPSSSLTNGSKEASGKAHLLQSGHPISTATRMNAMPSSVGRPSTCWAEVHLMEK